MPRHTLNAMLDSLRKSRLQAGDVVVYICLFTGSGAIGANNEERNRFYITKNGLQSLTNLKDASTRIPRIYEAIIFSDVDHLFKYQEEYHRMIFRDWTWCADPDDNEQNRKNEERYKQEIKYLVAQKKRDRQMKVEQKPVIIHQPRNDPAPILSLKAVFEELYKNKYGRLSHCNYKRTERLRELEQIFGRGLLLSAINYYFIADDVPNGTGAKNSNPG